MLSQTNAAVLRICDSGKYPDHLIHLAIVAFGDTVQRNKRVEHRDIDFVVANLLVDALYQRLVRHNFAVAAGDAQRNVAGRG